MPILKNQRRHWSLEKLYGCTTAKYIAKDDVRSPFVKTSLVLGEYQSLTPEVH
jgi:hypothetical protein